MKPVFFINTLKEICSKNAVSRIILMIFAAMFAHTKLFIVFFYDQYQSLGFFSSMHYKQSLKDFGHFPLWDNMRMCGVSEISNMPFPMSLTRLLSLSGFSSVFSYFLTEYLFLILGALCFFSLMRLYSCRKIVSFVGAFLYLFWLYKWPVIECYPMAMAPCLFLLCEKYEQNPRFIYIFLGAIVIGLTCSTGVIHGTAYIFLFHAILVAYLLSHGTAKKFCKASIYCWIFGLLLALPSILPQVRDLATSQRIFYVKEMFDLLHIGWTAFWMRFSEILQLKLFTPAFLCAYILAGISIYFIKDKKLSGIYRIAAILFVIHITLSYVRGYFKDVPVAGGLLNAIDLYRGMTLFGFLIMFFSTYTANALIEKYSCTINKNRLIAVSLFIAVFFVFLYQTRVKLDIKMIAIAVGVVAFIAVNFILDKKKALKFINLALVALLFYYIAFPLQIFKRYRYVYGEAIMGYNLPFFKTAFYDKYAKYYFNVFLYDRFVKRHTARKILQDSSSQDHFRAVDIEGAFNHNSKSRLYADGINSPYGLANIYSSRYYDFFGWLTNNSWNEFSDAAFAYGVNTTHNDTLLNLAGVKWIIAPAETESDRFSTVWSGSRHSLLLNKKVFPRIFTIFNLKILDDKKQMADFMMSATDKDLKQSVPILSSDLNDFPVDFLEKGGWGKARFRSYQPNEIVIETVLNKNGLLVLTDNFHNSWRATIDGVPTRIYPAYYTFRMVKVPYGKHIIRFFIQDNLFTFSLVASLLVFLGMVTRLAMGLVVKVRPKNA